MPYSFKFEKSEKIENKQVCFFMKRKRTAKAMTTAMSVINNVVSRDGSDTGVSIEGGKENEVCMSYDDRTHAIDFLNKLPDSLDTPRDLFVKYLDEYDEEEEVL